MSSTSSGWYAHMSCTQSYSSFPRTSLMRLRSVRSAVSRRTLSERRVGSAPVHDGDVVAAPDQLLHQREAVELRSADDEDLHAARAQLPVSGRSVGRSV